jgi:hypothetical protein
LKAFWKKEAMKGKDSKRTFKTIMPFTRVHKHDGGEDLEGNLEGDQVAHLQG